MIIPARHIAAYLDPSADAIPVKDENLDLCFTADAARILELADAGQIYANVRGSLRYVVLMVPISAVKSTERARQAARSASDAIAQDNRTVQRGRDITALHYDHNMRICRAYGSADRQLAHHAAAKLARQSRIVASNRPAALTFTQRASAQLAASATA